MFLRTPRAAITIALCLAALFACVPAASAAETTPTVKLSVKAPIAVRKDAGFTVSGTAAAPASAGETVTLSLSRRSGSTWSLASTTTAVLSAKLGFSARVKVPRSGHWRVSASLPETATHTAASATCGFKAVGKRVIALTFDDGPWPGSTAKILKALKAGDAQATFFVLGSQVKSRASLVKREVAEGHAVGVHSWNHAIMTRHSSSANKADLAKCKKAVSKASGKTPTWFRPPYGSTNSSVKKVAAKLGLRQVIWTVDTLDWRYRSKSSVLSRATRSARNGSVVLMHDGGGPRGATASAVPAIIKRLRKKGFDFATLDEMAALGYKIR